MRRFLASHTLRAGADERAELTQLAEAAHHAGVRAVETFYDPAKRHAYTLFEAPTEQDVRAVYAQAGLPAGDVFAAELVYTDLLDEPRRAR